MHAALSPGYMRKPRLRGATHLLPVTASTQWAAGIQINISVTQKRQIQLESENSFCHSHSPSTDPAASKHQAWQQLLLFKISPNKYSSVLLVDPVSFILMQCPAVIDGQ